LFTAFALAGCDQAAVSTRAPTTLTISGATAMQPVLHDLTIEFSRQHPNIVFDLRGGGSTLGETAAREGQVNLAASTLFAPTDLDPNADVDDELVRTPIGLDGVAIVTHVGNPVRDLTLLELQRLYSGRISDWATFGVSEGDVVLVSREDGSGSRILFESRVMGDEPVSLTSVVMPTSAAVVNYVSHNPQAIGYVSRAYVTDLLGDDPNGVGIGIDETKKGVTLNVIAVEGSPPTVDNFLGQRYALTQPLYLLTNSQTTGDASTSVRQFIDFTLSPAGQEIVGRYHARVR